MVFVWDEWNSEHVTKHGLTQEDAEFVVVNAQRPFPSAQGDDKYQVWGAVRSGRYVEVTFVYRSADEIDYEAVTLQDLLELSEKQGALGIYIIHAMPLTPSMLKQYRKIQRKWSR